MRERAKSGAKTIKARGWRGEGEREGEGKMETTLGQKFVQK